MSVKLVVYQINSAVKLVFVKKIKTIMIAMANVNTIPADAELSSH